MHRTVHVLDCWMLQIFGWYVLLINYLDVIFLSLFLYWG